MSFPVELAVDSSMGCVAFAIFPVFFFTSDAAGTNDMVLPIPNDNTLLGLQSYWQSLVIDAAAPGGFGLTISDAFQMKIGNWTYTK